MTEAPDLIDRSDPDRLLTVPEVAERLRRSPAQMRWMRHQGEGPRSAKIAGRIMYRRGDVEAWIQEQFDADTGTRAARDRAASA